MTLSAVTARMKDNSYGRLNRGVKHPERPRPERPQTAKLAKVRSNPTRTTRGGSAAFGVAWMHARPPTRKPHGAKLELAVVATSAARSGKVWRNQRAKAAQPAARTAVTAGKSGAGDAARALHPTAADECVTRSLGGGRTGGARSGAALSPPSTQARSDCDRSGDA